MTFMFSGCVAPSKKENVQLALQKRSEEKVQQDENVKNDKINPIITPTSPNQEYTVNQTIDYERIISTLTAEDDVDGDISEKIELENSNVKPHQEGVYEAVFKVADSAGNEGRISISINVTSKYSKDEKNRLMVAHNATKILKETKKLTNLDFDNIITNEKGEQVIVDYSGEDQTGQYIDGRILYVQSTEETQELDENAGYPSGFESAVFEYDEYDLEDFEKYYHLNEQ